MAVGAYELKSRVVVYLGMGGWRFLVIPKKQGGEIRKKFAGQAKGWGSIPVSVSIGNTTWNTSIFPDKKSGSYLLPLKAKVRVAEKITDDSIISFGMGVG